MENWKTILKEEGKAAAAAVLSRLAGLLLARFLRRTGSGQTGAGQKTAEKSAKEERHAGTEPESREGRISRGTEKFPENKKSGEKSKGLSFLIGQRSEKKGTAGRQAEKSGVLLRKGEIR